MRSDMKKLLDRWLLVDATALSQDLWRRGRRRLWRRRAVASATLLGLGFTGVVVQDLGGRGPIDPARRKPAPQFAPSTSPSPSEPEGQPWTPVPGLLETGGYFFEHLEFRVERDSSRSAPARVAVRGDVGWVDGFPGTRMCRWRVLDAHGEIIGSANGEFVAMGPSTGVLKDRIDVDGAPVGVEVSCSSERVDPVGGQLRVSDVRVEDGPRSGYVDVAFRYDRVDGSGPSPQLCEVEVRDASGASVGSSQATFHGRAGPGSERFPVDVAVSSNGGLTATVSCEAM
jgi:hypothetical protein